MKNRFIAFLLASFLITFHKQTLHAQAPTEKQLKAAFAPKGTHRAPFKKVDEVALTSVNIQFKLATRQMSEKKGVGNIITWGLLDGIDDSVLQDITDTYYQRLASKLEQAGYKQNNAYKDHKSYLKLVENGADLQREVNKKNWGVSKIFTANQAPYIEYPIAAMGAHASLGNDLKIPVGQIFITVDFVEILQKITKGVSSFPLMGRSERTDKFETEIVPFIRIEGITNESFGKAFRGDGTYAKFTGGNWSYSHALFRNDFSIISDKVYAKDFEIAKEIPENLRKFKSNAAADLTNLLSLGAVRTGRGTMERTFLIKADPAAFKAAVLDALDQYNEYLIAYIRANN